MIEQKSNIFFASDHAGFHLKQHLISCLSLNDYNTCDIGARSEESVDYPLYAKTLAEKILENGQSAIGVLICGSGIGMSIAANRFKGVRAALCLNSNMAKLARQHNNANVLVLGARLITSEDAIECLNVFLSSTFLGERHLNRVQMLDELT